MDKPVFISHASADRRIADQLCAALESHALRCWIAPRDIVPGTEWAEQIIDGIRGASAMALIVSAAANQSPQVHREVERAVSRRLPLVPLRIDATPLTKSLEYFLGTQHWHDATGDLSIHIPRFVEAVRFACRGTCGSFAEQQARPLPAELLARIETKLARAIGPIAPVLVRRLSAHETDRQRLVEALAREIDDAQARAAFLDELKHDK